MAQGCVRIHHLHQKLTNFSSLFENNNSNVLALLLLKLFQTNGRTQPGRATSNNTNIDLVLSTFNAVPVKSLVSPSC